MFEKLDGCELPRMAKFSEALGSAVFSFTCNGARFAICFKCAGCHSLEARCDREDGFLTRLIVSRFGN